MMNHHTSKGAFPPGWQNSSRLGIRHTSWMVNILPYLGESALYQKIQATPFKWPHDIEYFAIATVVKAFLCPDDQLSQTMGQVPPYMGLSINVAYTDYLGVAGKNRDTKDGLLFSDSQIKITDVVDGTSHTLLVGERPPSSDRWFGLWFTAYGRNDGIHETVSGVREFRVDVPFPGYRDCPKTPTDYQPPKSLDDPCSFLHFWSYHSGGANFLLADGSVRMIPYAASGVMEALSTRAGGEVVGDY